MGNFFCCDNDLIHGATGLTHCEESNEFDPTWRHQVGHRTQLCKMPSEMEKLRHHLHHDIATFVILKKKRNDQIKLYSAQVE